MLCDDIENILPISMLITYWYWGTLHIIILDKMYDRKRISWSIIIKRTAWGKSEKYPYIIYEFVTAKSRIYAPLLIWWCRPGNKHTQKKNKEIFLACIIHKCVRLWIFIAGFLFCNVLRCGLYVWWCVMDISG